MAVIGEIEAYPRERRLILGDPDEVERASQAEMQGQPTALIDLGHEMLAVPSRCNELATIEPRGERLRGHPAQNASIVHNHAVDPLAEGISCEQTLEAFHIGQLRHDTLLLSLTPAAGRLSAILAPVVLRFKPMHPAKGCCARNRPSFCSPEPALLKK
jgi:hypothetical protein